MAGRSTRKSWPFFGALISMPAGPLARQRPFSRNSATRSSMASVPSAASSATTRRCRRRPAPGRSRKPKAPPGNHGRRRDPRPCPSGRAAGSSAPARRAAPAPANRRRRPAALRSRTVSITPFRAWSSPPFSRPKISGSRLIAPQSRPQIGEFRPAQAADEADFLECRAPRSRERPRRAGRRRARHGEIPPRPRWRCPEGEKENVAPARSARRAPRRVETGRAPQISAIRPLTTRRRSVSGIAQGAVAAGADEIDDHPHFRIVGELLGDVLDPLLQRAFRREKRAIGAPQIMDRPRARNCGASGRPD